MSTTVDFAWKTTSSGCSQGTGAKNGPSEDLAELRTGPFTARSGVLRRNPVSLPSAQIKPAAAQVDDRNWNWNNKTLVSHCEGINEMLFRTPQESGPENKFGSRFLRRKSDT